MRLTILVFIFAAGFAFRNGVFGQCAVEGKVGLPGSSAERISNQRYQSGPEAPVGLPEPPMAGVYLEGVFSKTEVSQSRSYTEMAQKNINFAPGLLPVQVGTTVEFPNLDDTYHNVFSYSKTKRFDLGRYRKDEKPGTVLFDKPGVVTLHCEIHGTMRGTILVLDTPYFQRTDTQGVYRLKRLPAGHYLLKAWVGENDVRGQPVDLKDGATVHVDFPAK